MKIGFVGAGKMAEAIMSLLLESEVCDAAQVYASDISDERRDALAELELTDPVDWRAIKSQHRQLAMRHHPDRGGDEARLQAINAAMNVLGRAHKPIAK